MIGWLNGFRHVAGFGSYYSRISPIIALAFILLGCAWFFHVFNPDQRFSKMCALVLAFFILLIALINLIQFFTGVQIGIEETLVRKLLVPNPEVYSVTLMSPITDASFLLDSIAMHLISFNNMVLRDFQGSITGIASIGEDITVRRQVLES